MLGLVHTLIIALFSAGLSQIVRALPPFRGYVEREVKPWACDLCMAFWSTLFTAEFYWLWFLADDNSVPRDFIAGRLIGFMLWRGAPAFILALWLIKQTNGSPPIPRFEDLERGQDDE
jgi:hypothetical protein